MDQPTTYIDTVSTNTIHTDSLMLTLVQKVWFQLQDCEVTAVYPLRTAYSTLISTAATCEQASPRLHKMTQCLDQVSLLPLQITLPLTQPYMCSELISWFHLL